jgi:hypothetical protein
MKCLSVTARYGSPLRAVILCALALVPAAASAVQGRETAYPPGAYDQLRVLEDLAGPEWWRADAKPWQPLCDVGEVHEARGESQRALDCYDRAIAERGKARALLDLMGFTHLPESVAAPSPLGVWREAAMQLRLHQGLLAQVRVQHPPALDRIQALEAQVAADETRLQAAEQSLAQSNPPLP